MQAASDQTTVELKLSQGTRRYDYAYQVLDLVNQERAKKNLSPVTMDKNLLECAMTRAEELTIYVTCNGFSYMSSSLDPSSFTWATGDPSIATVDQNGVIRLKSKGNTTVTATLKS